MTSPGRTSRWATCAWLSLLAPLGAMAAEARAPLETVGLADAVRLALEHNPDFRSTGYDVAAAQGAVVQASVLPNPSVFLYTFGRGLSPLDAPLPTQFGVSWTLPVGGRISAATDAARASLDAARSTREAARRQLVVSVQTAFLTALLDRAQLEFSLKDQKGFQQELELNELRNKDGKIAFGDVLKLRIQAVSIDDTVREAALALEGARADLRRLLGEEVVAADFQTTGELTAPSVPGAAAAADLVSRTLKSRPDYLSLLDQERSARASVVAARRTVIPDVSVIVDYNRPGDGVAAPGSYDLSLSVPIPIFDRNQGNITQAEAAYEKALLAEESLRTQIRSDVTKALNEWQTSSALLAAYQGGVVAEAEQSLEITRHAYELGSGTLLDFLGAEASYRQIQSAFRAALARCVIAAHNLQFVTGEADQ